MRLLTSYGQQRRDLLFNASGTITTGGTAQLLLPEAKSRSLLMIQNISDTNMFVEFGSARATCTIAAGAVNAISIANSGFNFTKPPLVDFLGGGIWPQQGKTPANASFLGCGQPGYDAPGGGTGRVAKGTVVLSGASVGSITINDGGSGYVAAPYVRIYNTMLDPFGCATPSATSGYLLASSGGSLTFNGTVCPTDPIAIFCATTGKAFTCFYAD